MKLNLKLRWLIITFIYIHYIKYFKCAFHFYSPLVIGYLFYYEPSPNQPKTANRAPKYTTPGVFRTPAVPPSSMSRTTPGSRQRVTPGSRNRVTPGSRRTPHTISTTTPAEHSSSVLVGKWNTFWGCNYTPKLYRLYIFPGTVHHIRFLVWSFGSVQFSVFQFCQSGIYIHLHLLI